MLVPIRSFDDAKSRLNAVLAHTERAELARRMAHTVVAAAGSLPVWVVTDDDEVAAWASAVRAAVCRVGRPGLNASITAAVSAAADAGYARVIVAHADLPLAEDLAIVTGSGLAIAPDRHGDGSNVVSVPTEVRFEFAYGPGSFERHCSEAARLGLAVTVINEPSLAFDVDNPDDLKMLKTRTGSCGANTLNVDQNATEPTPQHQKG